MAKSDSIAARILRLYGLKPGEREQLERAQKGVCAICRRPPVAQRLHIDHCHKCHGIDARKSVRGLLCHACNRGLFRENPTLMRRAADYFEAHVCSPRPPRRTK